MVTVDAANIIHNYSNDFLKDHGESLGDDDERTLVDLLVDNGRVCKYHILSKVNWFRKKN